MRLVIIHGFIFFWWLVRGLLRVIYRSNEGLVCKIPEAGMEGLLYFLSNLQRKII